MWSFGLAGAAGIDSPSCIASTHFVKSLVAITVNVAGGGRDDDGNLGEMIDLDWSHVRFYFDHAYINESPFDSVQTQANWYHLLGLKDTDLLTERRAKKFD